MALISLNMVRSKSLINSIINALINWLIDLKNKQNQSFHLDQFLTFHHHTTNAKYIVQTLKHLVKYLLSKPTSSSFSINASSGAACSLIIKLFRQPQIHYPYGHTYLICKKWLRLKKPKICLIAIKSF